MITSRRGLFGFLGSALAAPTIIGIDRKMKFFCPPSLVIKPTQLIVPPNNFSAAFRMIVEPALREAFDATYDDVAAKVLNDAFSRAS